MNIQIARALASDKRILILQWLKDPTRHFPPQIDGALLRDGVCGVRIADKLGVSQPTASEIFYRRDPAGIRVARRALSEAL
jgi:hypothetical protein